TPASGAGVAVLRSSDLAVYQQTAAAFRRVYAAPVLELSLEQLTADEAIRRLRSASPEAVVAVGLRAAALIRDRLPRTPLVYCMVASPVRHQLVGSRITGIAADIPPALELGLLHAIAPDVRSVGVLVGKDSEAWAREARAAGERLGIEVRIARVASIEQLGPLVRGLVESADAIWLPADAEVATPEAFRFTMAEALLYRRPLLAFAPGLVRGGALAAAAPDLDWVGLKTAEAVRRIQSGERASDVPSLAIRQVRLVANLATARALGRELPPGALLGAELVR
ncbi:MAG: ABC transporter substrate binding protein, partial [Candidatus Eisenbacteria bacterium]